MITYLNGDYLPIEEAKVSVLDRGFLFADGVYEVIPVFQSKCFLLKEHLQRLFYSLHEIDLKIDWTEQQWTEIIETVVEKNGGGELQIYLQVTRGFDPIRQHQYPAVLKPTIFITAFSVKTRPREAMPLRAITVEDIRWKRCDIKSISLLPNVMALQEALKVGADEPILIRDGFAIESSRANLFIVRDNKVITAPKSHAILGGITRQLILPLVIESGYSVEERPIPEAELALADEIWISGSLSEIRPVLELNHRPVGTGKPGSVWEQVFDHYLLYKHRVIHAE